MQKRKMNHHLECIINYALTSERLVLFVLGGEAFLSGYVTSTRFILVLLIPVLLGVNRIADIFPRLNGLFPCVC